MKRILVWGLAVILLLLAGLTLAVRLNSDRIGAALSDIVREATGRPLTLASGPRLSFFPKLGLALGQAAWGDANDTVSARLDDATVTVALFPLLSGRVEIAEIRLGAPRVTLSLDAPANPAPSSASSPAPARPGTPQDSAMKLPDLSLSRLEIANGHLFIKKDGMCTEFEDLALTASDLGLGRNGNIAVEGVFLRRADAAPGAAIAPDATAPTPPATPDAPDAKDVRVRFALHSGLFLDASTLRLSNLKAEAESNGQTIALALPADGAAAFSLTTETLTLDKLALSFARNAEPLLTGSISAAIQPQKPSGEASFRLEGSLKDALAACGIRMETRDPAALTACSLDGRAAFAETELRLTLNAAVDTTPLKGEVTLAAPQNSPLRLTARLNAGQINADRYLPPQEAETSGTPATTAAPPASRAETAPASGAPAAAMTSWPDLDIRLAVQRLTAAGIRLDKLEATLTGAAGAYALRPCTFLLYGGAAELTADAKLAATPPRYGLNLRCTDVRLSDLLKDVAGTGNVGGLLSLSADLTANGPATAGESVDAALRRTLNGKGRVQGTNLSVKAGLIPSGAPAGVKASGSFRFSGLNGTFTAVNGLVALRDLTLSGKGVDAAAAGTINLPVETMDVSGTIRVGGIGVPVRVSGPLRAPSYAVDTRRLLQNTVEGVLKGGGDTKDKARQAGKALKGLLGL